MHDRRFNASVSSIRAAVGRAINHLKNWKILTTRFRRGLRRGGVWYASVDMFDGNYEEVWDVTAQILCECRQRALTSDRAM